MHYGVVGMRWGVRRFQPYPSRYKGNGKEVGEAKRKTRIGWDDDVVIKKGTKAYRISANDKDSGDMRYITVDENDRNFYKSFWPKKLKSDGFAGKDSDIYEQSYKLKEDMISPSAAKRQKVAAELTSNDEVVKEITRNDILRQMSASKGWAMQYTKEVMNYWENNDTNYKEYFKQEVNHTKAEINKRNEAGKAMLFLQSYGNSDRLKLIYAERFIKDNYNMLIDDFGADFAGNSQRVNAPIITLKAEQTLNLIGSKKISDYDSNKASRKYNIDISSIPGFMSEKHYVPNVAKSYYGTKNYYNNRTKNYIYNN